MRILLALFILPALAACQDETVTGYTDLPGPWTLIESSDGAPPSGVTLTFEGGGKFSGRGPCNRYFGRSGVPYPWFEAGAIGATKMACPQLEDENRYFSALAAMSAAEVSGRLLILSNSRGDSLTYRLDVP